MVDRPITLVEPALSRFIAGQLKRLRRPAGGVFGWCKPGDRMWVREPYHLAGKWAGLSPSAAARFGARPYFAADLAQKPPAEWPELTGKIFARNLLRIWHRQHLVIEAIDREPLQRISPDEIAAEGYADRAAWAAAWDRNLSLNSTTDCAWRFNPTVLVLTVRRVPEPLP